MCVTFALVNGNYTNNRYCFGSNFGIYCSMELESAAVGCPQLQYLNTGKSFNLYHHALLLSVNGNWLLDETQKNGKTTDNFSSYKMMIHYTLDEMNKLLSRVELLWKAVAIVHFHKIVTSNNYWRSFHVARVSPLIFFFFCCLML